MSMLHGKQIKGTSILFDKIDPSTGQTLTLVGTTKIQQPQAPVVGDDLANKTYVDSIASGLDPKEAVDLATIAAITATYSHGSNGDGVGATLIGTGALSLDGVAVSVGERLLIKNQSTDSQNGIYDVGTAGSNWTLTRALDFDGTPTNEVNGGEFAFVMSGNTLADTGWVVSSPSGVDATIGTTSIQWVQFSSSGVLTAGDGLYQSGNNISMGAADTSLTIGTTNSSVNTDGTTIQTGASGIEVVNSGITSTQLASSVAGAGLTGGAGTALSANVKNGIQIISDFIELGGSLTKNTTITGGGIFDLGFTGLNTFALGFDTTGTITDSSGASAGLVYAADYSAGFGNESLITKRYVDTQIATVPTGDITGVTAGQGLVGGGATGFLQMDVEIVNGVGLTFSAIGDGGKLTMNYNDISSLVAGDGLVANGTVVDVNPGTGLGVDTNNGTVYVNGNALSGTGITWNSVAGQFETTSGDVTGVTAGAGLSGGGSTGFLQMDVELTTNGGLTLSTSGDAGTIEVDEANLNYTTIATNLDGAGISANGTVLDVNLLQNGGLTFSGDSIITDNTSISSALAGNGLVQNGAVIDVNVGDGISIVADTVEASLVINSGLTFSAAAIDISLGNGLVINSGAIDSNSDGLMTGDLVNSGIATGSTIQAALEAMDTTLGNVEVSENISVDMSPAAAAAFTSGINVVSTATFSQTSDGDAWVFLNGASQVVGGTTASAWFFSSDGGTTARASKNPTIGDQLVVNIGTLGYSISGANTDNDIIEVKYDALS